jgi:hypothetical protein
MIDFIARTTSSNPVGTARAKMARPMLRPFTPGIPAMAWTFW